ncbi:hypothetical protein GQ457_02G032480 [Hibiscus cannabinus]
MFAASFDSKMGCLYSVFDVKKQGKPVWVVRAGIGSSGGENRLSGLLEGVSTFGFDSGIPRVTISGRCCDWTGSRGLHLLVSEPGYAIIGTVTCSLVTMLVWDGFRHPLLILPSKMWFELWYG